MAARIAIISDIHGNLRALDAVLADIARRGIAMIYCLGDLVGKGPDGAAALDRCQQVCAGMVRGNWDQDIADLTLASAHSSVVWHRAQLETARLHSLATLPNTIEFTLGNERVRLLHASEQGIHARVQRHAPVERHRALLGNTAFTGYDTTPTVVGYGDIHNVFVAECAEGLLFNAGSVGNPLDGTRATYAILSATDTQPGVQVEICRVAYAIELAITDAEAVTMPDLAAYAWELRTGRYRTEMPGFVR